MLVYVILVLMKPENQKLLRHLLRHETAWRVFSGPCQRPHPRPGNEVEVVATFRVEERHLSATLESFTCQGQLSSSLITSVQLTRINSSAFLDFSSLSWM